MNRPAATPSRSDAGQIRLTGRDIAGLVLAGEMHAAPYDLLGIALATRPDRVRALAVRWRRAGLAATSRIGPGPAWCWLTPAGMRAVGLGYKARPPGLGRLAHIRAVLAVRLALQAGEAFRDGQAWWRSERHLRSAAGPRAGSRAGRRSALAARARQPLPGRVLGDRGRADPQGHPPHRGDHDRAAHGDRGRPARPGSAV